MTSAPCSTPWLTSWTPCWTEPDLPAAFGGPHHRLPQRPPPPPAQRTPLLPGRGPACRPQPAAIPTAAPCGAERTFQNLTSQQSPLPPLQCVFWREDPASQTGTLVRASYPGRVVAGLLGCLLCPPPPVSQVPVPRSPGRPPCSPGALRGWRRRCVWVAGAHRTCQGPGPALTISGTQPTSDPGSACPQRGKAVCGRASGINGSLEQIPRVQTFPTVNVIF